MSNDKKSRLEIEREITRELLKNMQGHWATILPAIVPELREAVDAGPRKHVDCPFHGGRDDFRIHKDFDTTGGCICTCNQNLRNGLDVIMYARNVDFMTAKNLVIEALGGRITATHVPFVARHEPSPAEVAAQDAKIKARVQRVWGGTVALTHPRAAPVRTWLAQRGVGDDLRLSAVRCHPFLAYWEWDKPAKKPRKLGSWPAMVALVQRPDGKTTTVHRTWLTPNGCDKAPVPEPRKQESSPSTHPVRGSAIRIDPFDHPVLSVAEGIETALSARVLTADLGIPTWSVLNSELLQQVVVPSAVEVVIIWADRDRSQGGQAAAVGLVRRLRSEGKRAVVMLPPFAIPEGRKSIDWNDVVMELGVQAARTHPAFQHWRRRLREVLFELNHAPLARAIRS